jgi:hypothetical protein
VTGHIGPRTLEESFESNPPVTQNPAAVIQGTEVPRYRQLREPQRTQNPTVDDDRTVRTRKAPSPRLRPENPEPRAQTKSTVDDDRTVEIQKGPNTRLRNPRTPENPRNPGTQNPVVVTKGSSPDTANPENPRNPQKSPESWRMESPSASKPRIPEPSALRSTVKRRSRI